jgi:TPR repeat protein
MERVGASQQQENMLDENHSPVTTTHMHFIRSRIHSRTGATLGLAVLLIACKPATSPNPPRVNPPVDFNQIKAKAEQGDAAAQNLVGEMYAKGEGVRPDYDQAVKWYRQAAEQGNAAAENNLAMLFEAGQGVPHNEAEAAKWYRRAAQRGNANAQYNLGSMYGGGRGVMQDSVEAAKWYLKAAEQGDGLAQYNLGQRYELGKGVPKDPAEAFKWHSLAAAQGFEDAAKARDALKRKMNRDQLAEGQRRLGAFVPQKTSGSAPK